jgi:4-amino-4-deoxy-L-arabinose transferase-like glycosyltransferase
MGALRGFSSLSTAVRQRLSDRARAAAALAAACLITLYGGLLRLDAYVDTYGTLDRPTWARIATQKIAPVAKALHPSSMRWHRSAHPYVGGDPHNYLLFAREMTTFYQPHVREPVFLAMTRVSLWALDGQDAAISLASAVGSMLAVFATYLVGAALLSRAVGLLASLVMAIEYEVITWAPDGWRDDTFMAMVLFVAWTLLRLRARPTFGNAVLAGLVSGLACLTRITALTFVAAGLVWLLLDGPLTLLKERARRVALAVLLATAVVAPFLISCYIATGDPLFAINYHTVFYRFAEGQPIDEPMSAAQYVRTKFAAHPVATIDTAFIGLFTEPFFTKWRGLDYWMPRAGAVLQWLAVAGLGGWLFFGPGRLVLVVMLASLVPYVFTWNLRGGGEWRFMMHAYPFYVLAAAFATVGGVRVARAVARDPAILRLASLIGVAWRVAVVLAVIALGVVGYFGLPWYVFREAVANNESVNVEIGDRDRLFYPHGWSAPHTDGLTVRISPAGRSVVRFPLPKKRPYDIVLRMDPVDPHAQDRVSVLFNRHLVGVLRLEWSPERVGSYRLRIGESMVNVGSNELIIVPEVTVPAGAAGPRYAWLEPADRIGVRLWYVRVLP